MKISLYALPLIFFFCNALIVGGIIGIRSFKEQRLADTLMALFLWSLAILLLPYMLGFMGIEILWTELLFFPRHAAFTIGPLIYLFIKAQTNSEFRLKKIDFLHFIPFVIYVFYHLLVFMQGQNFVHDWISNYHAGFIFYVEFYGILFSNIIYLVLVILHFRNYLDWAKDEFVNREDLKFPWIKKILIVIIIAVIVSWIFDFLEIFGVDLSYEQSFWQFFGIGLASYYISIQYLMQKQPLFLQFDPPVLNQNKEILESDSENDLIRERLIHAMLEEKLYLVPDINLTGLAKKMKVNKSELSAFINKKMDKNFNQYINGYRVEAFKEAIENGENKNLSLLGIALNVGFSSKATFNRVFKQMEGMTPKEYLKKSEMR